MSALQNSTITNLRRKSKFDPGATLRLSLISKVREEEKLVEKSPSSPDPSPENSDEEAAANYSLND